MWIDETKYAKWCMMLIEGDTHMIEDIIEALLEDKLIDYNHEWIEEED